MAANHDDGPGDKIVRIADALAPLSDAAGVPRPDLAAFNGATLNVSDPIRAQAVALADLLRGRYELFVRNGVPGTIETDGRWRPMTADRLTTWLGRMGITTVKGRREPRPEDLSITAARQLLAADDLLADLPPINAVHLVRQPVLRAELDERGLPKLELLPTGYDEETGVYTIQTVVIDEEMHPLDGEEYLRRLLMYFHWSDPVRMAVQLAAMLTCFCREMYPGRAPAFIGNSNLPESGKSTLARLAFEPVFGPTGTQTLNLKDEEGLEKKLDTAARNFAPVLWFDDLKGKLYSNQLNAWLTAPSRDGRIMGTQDPFSVKVRTITFLTGAQLDLDDHLNRRSLWIDLFPKVPGSERVLPADAIRIDEEWFRDASERRKLLSALWAVVRHWDAAHRPGVKKKLGSFEGWSAVIPGIVEAAGWGDPLTRFEAPDAGDSEGRDIRALVTELIRNHAMAEGAKGYCTPEDILSRARLMGLFGDVLGTIEEIVADLEGKKGHAWETKSADGVPTDGEKRRQAARWRDRAIDRAWGALWKRRAVGGQEFVVDGRRFEFGDRRSGKERRYRIRELS